MKRFVEDNKRNLSKYVPEDRIEKTLYTYTGGVAKYVELLMVVGATVVLEQMLKFSLPS